MEQEITSLFIHFKREDYAYLLKTWEKLKPTDFVASPDLLPKMSRKDFAQKAVYLCKKKKITIADIHNLHLIYVQKYNQKKHWTVYKLEKIPGSSLIVQDPATFSENLEAQLDLFYKASVCVRLQNQVYWVRISIQDKTGAKKVMPASVIYLVHHPRTEYMMVASLKASQLNHVMQSMLTVLDCQDVEQLNLKGHHLDSLMQLAVNKYSQGAFSAYRLCQVDDNALTSQTKRKRGSSSQTHEDSEETGEITNIVFENKSDKSKRLKLVQETFGKNLLPVLEKVEYKLETKFRGTAYAPGMATEELFHCKVKFEGPNVLEGIRSLGRVGLAEMPMKDHLGKLHTMAMNTISLRAKRSRNASEAGV